MASTPGGDDSRRFMRVERIKTAAALAWALVGGLVVLYIFFVTIGSIDPTDTIVVSIVVLVLALAWLAHSWRRIWSGGFASKPDRERRGF